MLGISRKYLENIKEHLQNKGFTTRTHGNTGRTPRWDTKMNINQTIRKEVKNFLENYAETHGLPNSTKPIIELPTDMSYQSVYNDFIASQAENSNLKRMKYHILRKL